MIIRPSASAAFAVSLTCTAACTGTIISRGEGDAEGADPCMASPGPSPIRRLTRTEYNNTVRDLLADSSMPASDFPAEEKGLGFDNNADVLTVAPILADKYMLAAEAVAERAV